MPYQAILLALFLVLSPMLPLALRAAVFDPQALRARLQLHPLLLRALGTDFFILSGLVLGREYGIREIDADLVGVALNGDQVVQMDRIDQTHALHFERRAVGVHSKGAAHLLFGAIVHAQAALQRVVNGLAERLGQLGAALHGGSGKDNNDELAAPEGYVLVVVTGATSNLSDLVDELVVGVKLRAQLLGFVVHLYVDGLGAKLRVEEFEDVHVTVGLEEAVPPEALAMGLRDIR